MNFDSRIVQRIFGYMLFALVFTVGGFVAGFLWTADDAYNLGWKQCSHRVAYEVHEALTTMQNPDIFIGPLRIQLVNRDRNYYKVTYTGANIEVKR